MMNVSYDIAHVKKAEKRILNDALESYKAGSRCFAVRISNEILMMSFLSLTLAL